MSKTVKRYHLRVIRVDADGQETVAKSKVHNQSSLIRELHKCVAVMNQGGSIKELHVHDLTTLK